MMDVERCRQCAGVRRDLDRAEAYIVVKDGNAAYRPKMRGLA
jgi:hypothetical protein